MTDPKPIETAPPDPSPTPERPKPARDEFEDWSIPRLLATAIARMAAKSVTETVTGLLVFAVLPWWLLWNTIRNLFTRR